MLISIIPEAKCELQAGLLYPHVDFTGVYPQTYRGASYIGFNTRVGICATRSWVSESN